MVEYIRIKIVNLSLERLKLKTTHFLESESKSIFIGDSESKLKLLGPKTSRVLLFDYKFQNPLSDKMLYKSISEQQVFFFLDRPFGSQ